MRRARATALLALVVAMGACGAPFDFGGGPIASNHLLAELTASGAHVFSGPLVPATLGASLQIHDVVLLADGQSRVLVTANSPFVFGDTTISAGPGDTSATVVLAFDAAGVPVTASSVGAGSISGVAIDAAGRVHIAGIFRGSFDAGCGPLVSKGDWDVFAAALLP